MQPDLPADLLEAELPFERFGLRPQGVLQRLGARTVGAFLATDWDTAQCWQLGARARAELKAHRVAMGQTAPEVRAWLDAAPNQAPEIGTPAAPTKDPLFHAPAHWHDLPPVPLGVRARGVLRRSHLTTLGAFLEVDLHVLQCYQLGTKVRAELLEAQAEQRQRLLKILASADPICEFEKLRQELLSVSVDKAVTLPAEEKLKWIDAETLDLPLLWPMVVRAIGGRNERTYDVLVKRFDLDGKGRHTFNQLRLDLRVSRQRVHQIEQQSLANLRKFLGDGRLHGAKEQAHPSLLAEISTLSEHLEQVGFPLSDECLWEVLAERYRAPVAHEARPYFVLLCHVLNLPLCRPGPPDVLHDLDPVWLGATGSRSIAVSAKPHRVLEQGMNGAGAVASDPAA